MTVDPHQTNLAPYGASQQPGNDPAALAVYQQYGPAVGASAPTADDNESLWRLVDDRLRGRWKWMILLAGVLGVALTFVGWRSAEPMYESVGVIRVSPKVPVTRFNTPEGELHNFAMFMNTQVQLIAGRRVLENAMNDDDIRALDWSSEPDSLGVLESGLTVSSDRNTELIYIAYESEDSRTAQVVTNAVIHSYHDIYGKAGGNEVGNTLERLRDVEQRFRRELHRTQADIRAIQDRYGVDPRELQRIKLQRIEDLDEQIFNAERSLVYTQAQRPGNDMNAMGSPPPSVLARLEAASPEFAAARMSRDMARQRLEMVKLRYRPQSNAYRRAEENATQAEKRFQEQYGTAMTTWDSDGEATVANAGDYEGWVAESLRSEITTLQTREEEIKRESQALNADVALLKEKHEAEELVKNELNGVMSRVQQLEVEEQNIAGRISIEQEGIRPHNASSDKRIKRAAMGMVGSWMMSFGLFFLWGSLDRRAFGAEQVRNLGDAGMMRMLGVLPELENGLDDPETSDVASHCMHQIRNQIEAIRIDQAGYVIGVSSPFQGDGKTSIALALGWSYAVAGYRCLLVDADLVGRSLTRQVGMGARDGLKEAILSHDTNGLISSLEARNLDVLPVGRDTEFGPERLRKVDLENTFAQLRENYDIVIVDTGPLLGSLESMLVAAAADGMVLSVRRGRSRTRLEECIDRINSVGAHCLGVILNCATRADCFRSVSESSIAAANESRVPKSSKSGGRSSIISVKKGEQNPLVMAMEQNQSGRNEASETE